MVGIIIGVASVVVTLGDGMKAMLPRPSLRTKNMYKSPEVRTKTNQDSLCLVVTVYDLVKHQHDPINDREG